MDIAEQIWLMTDQQTSHIINNIVAAMPPEGVDNVPTKQESFTDES